MGFNNGRDYSSLRSYDAIRKGFHLKFGTEANFPTLILYELLRKVVNKTFYNEIRSKLNITFFLNIFFVVDFLL